MKYEVRNTLKRWHKPAIIWTFDGVITCATQAYQWAVGQTFASLQGWWEENDRAVRLVSMESMPPGGFLTHQIPELRRILHHTMGPPAKRRKPALELYGKTINVSRDRSQRLWKKLLQKRFSDDHWFSVHNALHSCMRVNDTYFKGRRRV